MSDHDRQHLPKWMKMRSRLPADEQFRKTRDIVALNHLHTICSSGNCPNIGECWSAGTATFLILGDICTRNCKFCGVSSGKPAPPDRDEPLRLAETILKMHLKHAVITSVDRDDLPDGGAGFWADTIRTIKRVNPHITMETLIPDFDGEPSRIQQIINEQPDVISHNLETVRRLTPQIRSRAKYETSLSVLHQIAQSGIVAKSGLMLGLGEEIFEVEEAMDDLIQTGCSVLTLGQYMQPTRDHIPVSRWIKPELFEELRQTAFSKGFVHVESDPLVRSSYHAEKHVRKTISL
ncbi:MAG: lipoyl synthase [Bacteroidales bacterium]|nr:lipoyl synthase [Bacteroidales bacterium]